MENTELINEVIDGAKEAYVFAQEKGLDKPIVKTAKEFIGWFGGLFSRKAHVEQVKLMEELKTNQADLDMLKNELKALAVEQDGFIKELEDKLGTLNQEKEKTENQNALSIVNSKLKNVNFGDINSGGGDVNFGDKLG